MADDHTIDTALVERLQKKLGVPIDGNAGRITFTAFFAKLDAPRARAEELGLCAAVHLPAYGLLASASRLSQFSAQLVHESGSFRYMEEIWGPTPTQRGYEGREDLGNTQPGDGLRYKGRGPIQSTGRENYRTFGRRMGIDLERHPELAAIPSIGLIFSLEYWKAKGLNRFADRDDIETITRRINGGLNGFEDRKMHLRRIRSWLA